MGAGRNGDQPKTILKTEQFDRDPGWEGHDNRIVPKVIKPVQQDFDYSATNFAGKAKGGIGDTKVTPWIVDKEKPRGRR